MRCGLVLTALAALCVTGICLLPPASTSWLPAAVPKEGAVPPATQYLLEPAIDRPWASRDELCFPDVVRLHPGSRDNIAETRRVSSAAVPALKVGLVPAIGYCAAIYIAYLRSVDTGGPILLHTFVVGYSILLCWILRDQRRRCPVCVRFLSHQASVGKSSRIFLDWSVTEWMCSRGHGLLHVPGTPTSWFGTQLWLAIDRSWSGLFTR